MRKLSILIVEDDEKAIERLCKNIDGSKYTISGITGSTPKAVSLVKENKPDIMILDLELHLGEGTGIDILENIKPYVNDIFILVTTNNLSKIVYDTIRDLGADFILSKHQANYSEASAINLLNKLNDSIKNKSIKKSEILDIETVKDCLFNDLQNIGFNPKHSGVDYLIESISYHVEGNVEDPIQKVADNHNKTKFAVERAMQNAIDWTWTNGDTEDLLKYYKARVNPSKGHPTITEFICYFSKIYTDKKRPD